MPLKELFSPFKNGVLKDFKFGGGANTIVAYEDSSFPGVGYKSINGGGGNDNITGSINDDLILGGDGSDILSGGFGDDEIYGGNALGEDSGKGRNSVVDNTLFGDAAPFNISGVALTGVLIGGNDTLHGSDNVRSNMLVGDFGSISSADEFVGGDDTLVSGMNSADTMYGDWTSSGGVQTLTGGEDTFVFGPNNGADIIADFRNADGDQINLCDTALKSFADLDTGADPSNPDPNGVLDDSDAYVTITGDSTEIDIGAAAGGAAGLNLITVQDVTGLTSSDFEFTDWMVP